MPSLKVIHYILLGAHQIELFLNKIFFLNSVSQIVLFMVFYIFIFSLTWDFVTILRNIDIHNLTGSIPAKNNPCFILY